MEEQEGDFRCEKGSGGAGGEGKGNTDKGNTWHANSVVLRVLCNQLKIYKKILI